ncbi:DUF3180 domain-containing protein [Aeromicrobium phragmitis]|uniref:DUF3180 domain-containing protein n=1 Tax=Aeromicrobium phragmitis TaxID=2478914 RepID=A0A3L8PII5_9ACTN|nr:DUF3180 domain-containing protein [Aeromicrobium phragmitis]RLV54960.1 DUF3180 domain-containing protein [Aeromicrobium phragmitis]
MRRAKRSSALYVTALLAVGLVIGRLLPPLAVRFEGQAPRPSWAAAVILATGAVIVGALAWNTWQTLHRRHLTIHVDRAIQLLAIAKSCVMVGAVFAGGYGGFALAYIDVDSVLARERLLHAGAAAIAAGLLLAAALVLEWACQLPGDDDENKDTAASPA